MPFNAWWIGAVDQHGVEAARRLAAQHRKIGLRSGDQSRTLRPRDAGRSAAVGVGLPLAHFDEDERLAIARDDVDLAHARAEVAPNDDKSASREKIRRKRLGARAFVDRPRVSA